MIEVINLFGSIIFGFKPENSRRWWRRSGVGVMLGLDWLCFENKIERVEKIYQGLA